MNITIKKTTEEMAQAAAHEAAKALNDVIAAQGKARLVLSTGASQLEAIQALTKEDVKWDCVTMFHLDEYVGLPEAHIASFRKYLKERFVNVVHPAAAYFVNGEVEDMQVMIDELTQELRKEPVDVALIGIGENAHIAFNDPPANFDTQEAYIVVDLDEACKRQQMNEGWFATMDDVPKQAVSMTVHQIMASKKIITIVPGERKAWAIEQALSAKEITNMVPATMLKSHPDWHLFCDSASSANIIPCYE